MTKEDIFELMLLFLTCVCIENKRDGLNIPEEKKVQNSAIHKKY